VVLPEDLCTRLAALAEADSRTISNLAKVLIQQGVERLERQQAAMGHPTGAAPAGSAPLPSASPLPSAATGSERTRELLVQQHQDGLRAQRFSARPRPRRLRLRGASL
jgi:CopG-like RHH_1 or ribbon-helix-helix domain, RHH_5